VDTGSATIDTGIEIDPDTGSDTITEPDTGSTSPIGDGKGFDL
jgi:hypothetical protein